MAIIVISATVIGIVIGAIISRLVLSKKASGALRVDTSDPDDGPYIFLELSEDIRGVLRKEYVTLRVKLENYVSQK